MIEHRAMGAVRDEGRTLRGLAVPYGVETRINGGTESIRAGAVTASLAGRDILALVDHDAGKVLGRTRSGTLRLAEDERGLSFEIDLPETTAARDVLALVERGDAGGMSFGFNVPKGGDEWRGTHRTLRTINLHEISVITSHPAYQATTVEARGAGTRWSCCAFVWRRTGEAASPSPPQRGAEQLGGQRLPRHHRIGEPQL